MITRIWHGRTLATDADEYLKYVQESGLSDYISTPGNLSAKILWRIEDNVCHFYTISEWDNIESVKSFAGNEYEKARYYPQDEKYLLEFEEKVLHCETFTASKDI